MIRRHGYRRWPSVPVLFTGFAGQVVLATGGPDGIVTLRWDSDDQWRARLSVSCSIDPLTELLVSVHLERSTGQ